MTQLPVRAAENVPSSASSPGSVPATGATGSASAEEEDEEEEEAGEPPTMTQSVPSAPAPVVEDYSVPKFFADGPFSALFPGRPQRKKTTDKILGEEMTTYWLREKGRTMQVSFCDVTRFLKSDPKMAEDATHLYDYVEMCDAHNKHTASIKDADLSFNGIKSRECELSYTSEKDGKTYEKRLLTLVSSRLFIVDCAGSAEAVNSPESTKFLCSFSLRSAGGGSGQWAAQMRSRDVEQFMKPVIAAQEKKRRDALIAAEAASYVTILPHLDYVADFPHRISVVSASASSEKKSVVFSTAASYDEVLKFYTTKLKSNGWTLYPSSAGTVLASITPPHKTASYGSYSYPSYVISLACRKKNTVGSDVALEYREKWISGFAQMRIPTFQAPTFQPPTFPNFPSFPFSNGPFGN